MNLNVPPISYFVRDGLKLAYFDEGNPNGEPVLLIHGFASTAVANWVNPGWLKVLDEAGYRVIAIDNRGHGMSDKPYDADVYHPWIMAEDAVALLDHLGIPEAHVMGYSMGARVSTFMAIAHPDRVRSLVLGGLGIGMVEESAIGIRLRTPCLRRRWTMSRICAAACSAFLPSRPGATGRRLPPASRGRAIWPQRRMWRGSRRRP
ncbi:alpha/beta hydrolase [Rhizobium sp. RCAM05973]|uniref:alpha/beta fold hydrolase n=1 Tax=Rhizobium sp. RCAM05973 TaxID=2994066 RepID=UPI0022EC0940|nr:alpha/beta hydrolase [Rhizobium sp. RCAM05973]